MKQIQSSCEKQDTNLVENLMMDFTFSNTRKIATQPAKITDLAIHYAVL